MATENTSDPKQWAQCLELVREMSFPVVAAPTVMDNFPFIFHEGFQADINFNMVSSGVMIKVPCEWIKDHLVISQVLFFISENSQGGQTAGQSSGHWSTWLIICLTTST